MSNPDGESGSGPCGAPGAIGWRALRAAVTVFGRSAADVVSASSYWHWPCFSCDRRLGQFHQLNL